MQRPGRVIGITRAHRPGNRVVIIFCGGDVFHRSIEGGPVLAALARNADVVLFDYPGFGTSTGAPNPDSILDNARAAAEYVSRLATTAGQKQVIYGFSLGGAVAAQLAGERPFDGVVLEATAPDVGSWARSQVPWFAKPLVRIEVDPALARIDNARALASFRGSILILAGERDKRAPPELSRRLAQRLKDMGVRAEYQEIRHASHGDIYKSPLFEPAIDRFLAGLRGAP
jgi:pimeloyl-ACP methyl ester carboxylesterase